MALSPYKSTSSIFIQLCWLLNLQLNFTEYLMRSWASYVRQTQRWACSVSTRGWQVVGKWKKFWKKPKRFCSSHPMRGFRTGDLNASCREETTRQERFTVGVKMGLTSSVYCSWIPWKLSFRYILFHEKKTPNDAVTPQRQSQFTPKMKANAVPRLLSSLVWIDQYNECIGMTSFMEFMSIKYTFP